MPRLSQSAKAPANAPSASTPMKASGKKRARDDTDADVETTTPKRQRVKNVSTTEPESAGNADTPSTPTSIRKTRTPAKRPAKKAPIVMPTLTPIPEESVTSAGPSDAASSTPAPAPKKRGKKTVAFESPVVTASAAANDTPAPPPATPKTRTPVRRTPRKTASAGPSDAAPSTNTSTPKRRGKTVAVQSPVVAASASQPEASMTNASASASAATPKKRTTKNSTPTPQTKKGTSTPRTRSTTRVAESSTETNVIADEATTPVPKKTTTQAKKSRGKAAGASEDAPKASTPAPKKTAAPKKAATSKKTAAPKRATKRELTADPEEPTDTPKPKRLRTKSLVAESSASAGESSASAAAEEASNTSTNLPGPSATSSGRDPVEVSDLAALLQQGPSIRRKTSRKPAPKPRRRLVSRKELNAAAAAAKSDDEEQAETSSVVYKNAGEKRIHEETFRRVHEDSTPRPVKRAKTKPSSSIDLVPQQSARSINSITSRTTDDIRDVISLAAEDSSNDNSDVASQSSASNEPSNDDAASYPSTCLYQNHALNPLQARVPKSARLHLRHSSAADASSAYGIVPVSLRRLLRCSIRIQTLYARHGLAGMDDAELPLPPWVTRETAFSYETYVSSHHNHIWVSNNWWTTQRLLDLYALALYMQDPDCCDAAASALIRLARAAADNVEEHVLELDVAAFLQQLDWLADLVPDDDDDRDDENYDDDDDEKLHLRTVALANSAPIRALLLDILSAPPHAAATLKALSSADVLYADDAYPFFTDLQTACRTRLNTRKRFAVPSPLFMAQERKWCERYHFHAHWFPLDDAELLFPPSEGEDDPSVADRGCHALRALRLVEEEQMPEARGEREVWEEEKRMYEEWQGCGIEGYEMETFECSRVRLGDRGKWRVGGDDGVEVVMKEDY